MSTIDPTIETSFNENTLIDELVTKMGDLETKFRDKFRKDPLPHSLIEIIQNESQEQPVDPLKLCAIFSDFAEAYLEEAFDCNQVADQNSKLNKELYKANDLIRRLTDENEYHLSKLKFMAKQLEIYKNTWRGKVSTYYFARIKSQ